MKKIIPFSKEIIFKTNLAEITSISLEHSLHKEDEHLISGAFSLTGEYKITDSSTNTEIFSYDLPFDIHMDDHYLLDNITVDIDDFYYEIVNENVLSIHIDVCVDRLEEKPLIEKKEEKEVEKEEEVVLEETRKVPDVSKLIEEAKEEIRKEIKENLEREETVMNETETVETVSKVETSENSEMNSVFSAMDESETYMTYRVYIVREGDSLEQIINKYGVTKEELGYYNDLSEVKIGDKLIIPAKYNETSE